MSKGYGNGQHGSGVGWIIVATAMGWFAIGLMAAAIWGGK